MPIMVKVRARMSAIFARPCECIQFSPITLFLICVTAQFRATSLLLILEGDAKIGLRVWGNSEYSNVPKKIARYFSRSERPTLVGSGPGEIDD